MTAAATALSRTYCEGDRLSRAEFVSAGQSDPDRYQFAERIDGRLVMNAASVRREGHGRPNSRIVGLLVAYEVETPGVEVGDNSTAQIDDDHDPQPDAYLLVLPEYGGQVEFTESDFIRNAPEMIVEIAGHSLATDLGRKKAIYEADGCREYLVWATDERRFYCFRNGTGGFEEVSGGTHDGVFRSVVFPGLWIDMKALLADDLRAAMTTLRRGLESTEHAAFASELASRVG